MHSLPEAHDKSANECKVSNERNDGTANGRDGTNNTNNTNNNTNVLPPINYNEDSEGSVIDNKHEPEQVPLLNSKFT